MNPPQLIIRGRAVGPAHVPLVVAELGINHGGSLQVAREMVDAAARAGVEVLKHQTHVVEDEMSAAAKHVVPGNADISIYEIMARCSLSESSFPTSKSVIILPEPVGHSTRKESP